MTSQAITAARRVTMISPEMADQVEGYFEWLRTRTDAQCRDFLEAQESLRQPQVLAWTPAQKYLLFLFFASGQTMTDASQNFSLLGYRSARSAYDMLKCLKLLTGYNPPIQYFMARPAYIPAQSQPQIKHEPTAPQVALLVVPSQVDIKHESSAARAAPSQMRLKQEASIARSGMVLFC